MLPSGKEIEQYHIVLRARVLFANKCGGVGFYQQSVYDVLFADFLGSRVFQSPGTVPRWTLEGICPTTPLPQSIERKSICIPLQMPASGSKSRCGGGRGTVPHR